MQELTVLFIHLVGVVPVVGVVGVVGVNHKFSWFKARPYCSYNMQIWFHTELGGMKAMLVSSSHGRPRYYYQPGDQHSILDLTQCKRHSYS